MRAKPLKDTKCALKIRTPLSLRYALSILAFLERSLALNKFSPGILLGVQNILTHPRQRAGDKMRAKPLKETKCALKIRTPLSLRYAPSILAFF